MDIVYVFKRGLLLLSIDWNISYDALLYVWNYVYYKRGF